MSHILYVISMQPILESDSLPLHKKIGITNDTQTRAAQLQTKMPFKMYVEAAWEIPDGRALELETALHKLLDGLNIDGEWFQDPDETLVEGLRRLLRFTGAKPITETALEADDGTRSDLEARYRQTEEKVRTLLGDTDPALAGWKAQPARAVDQRFVRDGCTVYVQPNSTGATLATTGRDGAAGKLLRDQFGAKVQRAEYANGQVSERVSVSQEELRRFFAGIKPGKISEAPEILGAGPNRALSR